MEHSGFSHLCDNTHPYVILFLFYILLFVYLCCIRFCVFVYSRWCASKPAH